MYSTSVFYYIPRQTVVLLIGNSPRKYMPIYAKTMTLHKGVDNVHQFQFLNQEQRPVDITNKEITCRIINNDGSSILLQKGLTLDYPLTGIASLVLNASDIEHIDPQNCHYSLEIPVGNFDFPVYVDNDAGARGLVKVVDSVLPRFIPSMEITIPSGQTFPAQEYNVSNTTYTYTSSVISTENNAVLTMQIKYSSFYGTVNVQGSTVVDSGWYNIYTADYTNTSDTIGYAIEGYHPFVRVEFVSNAGSVATILAR